MAEEDDETFKEMVDPSLDYREIPEPRGFTRAVHRVRDVTQYVIPVSDMGRGVLIAPFKLPAGTTDQELNKKFFAMVKGHSSFQRLPEPVHAANEIDSITHLAPHGQVGIYKYGGSSEDLYIVCIQSHDVVSSHGFRMNIYEMVKEYVKDADDDVERGILLNKRPKPKYTIDSDHYRHAIDRGKANRLYLLNEVFVALGVTSDTKKMAIGNATFVVSANPKIKEFPCVFLEREHKTMRIYNWAYSIQSVLEGAPWFMLPHEGLYSFFALPDVMEMVAGGNVTSASMGLPVSGAHIRVNDPAPQAVNALVSSLVTWQSSVSVLFQADPRLYVPPEEAFKEFKAVHDLLLMQVCRWRTIAVALHAPDPDDMELEELAMHSTTESTRIIYTKYPDLASRWTSLMLFETNRKACVWYAGEMKRQHVTIPEFSMVPLCDLFSNYAPDMLYNNIDTATFRRLMINYEIVRETMEDVSDWEIRAPTTHLAHEEKMAQIASETKDESAGWKTDAFANTDTDCTSAASDTESRKRHELKRRALHKVGKKAVESDTSDIGMGASSFYEDGTGLESGTDVFADNYSELE